MKLFSRKAVAAVATTVALTTAGLSAPAFAEETDPTDGSTQITKTTDEDASSDIFSGSSDLLGSSTDEDLEEGEESSSKDPNQIKSWIGVFTAIVGALSTAFIFVQRLTA